MGAVHHRKGGAHIRDYRKRFGSGGESTQTLHPPNRGRIEAFDNWLHLAG